MKVHKYYIELVFVSDTAVHQIAVEGCCHGELDRTYATLKDLELQTNQKADALIICGDFQAIRNQSDLLCMAVPQKYRQLGQFHQ